MQVSIPGILPNGTLKMSSLPLEGEWKIEVKGNETLTGKLRLTRTQGRYTAEFPGAIYHVLNRGNYRQWIEPWGHVVTMLHEKVEGIG